MRSCCIYNIDLSFAHHDGVCEQLACSCTSVPIIVVVIIIIIIPNYQYRLGNSFILRTDCIKDLGVHIDCNIIFIVISIFFFHMH
jgi:hypothetical protein